MGKEIFYCSDNVQSLFKKKNDKGLYLEISDTMITGKGIIYLENRRNEYIGDINYEIKTITRVEQTTYQRMDTFVIYVRASSLYGVEKVQIRLPGMKDASRAADMLRKLMEENKDVVNSVTRSMYTPEPVQRSEFPPPPGTQGFPAQPNVAQPNMAQAQAPGTQPQANMAQAQAPGTQPQAQPQGNAAGPQATATQPQAQAQQTAPAAPSVEEYEKKLARLETIYQTGIMTEKEYKTSKAEYISMMNGLESFFNKVKVNLQYSEIGFLSEAEFNDFKNSTVSECSNLNGVSLDTLKQNLNKLQVLNLCDILSAEEYQKICSDIAKSVQYATTDSEDVIISKIEKWPLLKECSIITEVQYDQLINVVADDTRIKVGDSIPILEHKLLRLTTLSKTFIFTEEEFAAKKKEFVADMTALDYSSTSKLKSQLERVMTLKRCNWMTEDEYQTKKQEIMKTIEDNKDLVTKMQLYGLLSDISFISKDEYNKHKNEVIDGIFQSYTDASELQMKAKNLMDLKAAGIINDAEFNDFKKRLLTL